MATPEPWSVRGTVAQAPLPAIGSIAREIVGFPAAEEIVWAVSELKSTSPGCRALQLEAVYGPPDGAVAGQVSIVAVADGWGWEPEPFR